MSLYTAVVPVICAHVRTFFGFKLFYCLWLLISTVQVRFQKDLENNIFNQLKCLSVIRWRFITTVTLWSVSSALPHFGRTRRSGPKDLFCFKKLKTNKTISDWSVFAVNCPRELGKILKCSDFLVERKALAFLIEGDLEDYSPHNHVLRSVFLEVHRDPLL